MAEYKSGTVAVATVRGKANVRVVRSDVFADAPWWSCGNYHPEREVTDIRVLAVLDLAQIDADGATSWPEVVGILRDCNSITAACIADQIEEQMRQPRMPEPQIIGAVILAAQKGECEGSERMWTRFTLAREHCWIDTSARLRSWDELDHPRPWGQS